MKYAVDLIIRVMSEGEDKESAELAACQPGVDWNEGYLINLDSIPEEHILKCDHCHVVVSAYDYGYDDTLRHAMDCPAAEWNNIKIK